MAAEIMRRSILAIALLCGVSGCAVTKPADISRYAQDVAVSASIVCSVLPEDAQIQAIDIIVRMRDVLPPALYAQWSNPQTPLTSTNLYGVAWYLARRALDMSGITDAKLWVDTAGILLRSAIDGCRAGIGTGIA